MSEVEPRVLPNTPAPEISDKEYPVPQEILDWEADHMQEPSPEE